MKPIQNIVIDAGHLRVTGKTKWGSIIDHGVVDNISIPPRLESGIAHSYALTLKHLLVINGFSVKLTRDNVTPVSFSDRTNMLGDLFISLHCDCANCQANDYYASVRGTGASRQVAESIVKETGGRALPSTASRFGRLYIDDSKCTHSILIEIDDIVGVVDTRESRIDFCNKIVRGIVKFNGGGVL